LSPSKFECRSADQAVRRAEKIAEISGVVGVLAFSQVGDLEAGVFDDIVFSGFTAKCRPTHWAKGEELACDHTGQVDRRRELLGI
jgi:hypothetical protein